MREGKYQIITWISAVVLIGISVFCMSATAYSRERIERRERESCYRELEAAYVQEIRTFLAGEGYSDSGVMMTRVIDADESRAYTVTIHHRSILALGQEERQQLNGKLKAISYDMENCTVEYQFL